MDFATPYWIPNLVIFLIGTWVLIKGSDVFVDAAAAIARSWHVPELVIGLTLVSIGTSLPELSTSAYAQAHGDSDFVIGNILGSNVTNILLILGAGVVMAGKLDFSQSLLKRDMVVMNVLFVVALVLFGITRVPGKDGAMVPGLNWWECLLLLIAGIAYCWLLFRSENGKEEKTDSKSQGNILIQFGLLILGLIMIFFGSKGMVDTVSWTAAKLAVPTMIISATIVAFGTSVPELAVTIAGVLKKQNDIAIGNVIGSCIFNIFMIFGICGLIAPLGITSGMVGIINSLLILPTALILTLFMYTGKRLVRWEGIVFLLGYCAFFTYNLISALHQ